MARETAVYSRPKSVSLCASRIVGAKLPPSTAAASISTEAEADTSVLINSVLIAWIWLPADLSDVEIGTARLVRYCQTARRFGRYLWIVVLV